MWWMEMFFKKLKRNYFLIVLFIVFLICMGFLLSRLHADMLQLDATVSFSEGWHMEADKEQNVVVFRHEITEEMLGKVVYFHAYDAFVDAEVDGSAVYHYGESHSFLKSPGTLWHLITVHADTLGEELSIRIQYAYANKFSSDIDMRLGSSGAVIIDMLKSDAPDLAVNITMLVLGIILCAIFFIQLMNKMHLENCLYLGLLSICFVFLTNNNLFFTQLIFPSGAGQYFVYYFFLFMIPLLLICYLETITEELKFNYLFWTHVCLSLVITALQLSGIAEFTETIGIFLLCSATELVIVMLRLLKNRRSQTNRRLMVAFVVMIACILVNAGLYFFHSTTGVKLTVGKIGISLYLLVSIYDSLTSIITDLAEAKQSKILRKIAFTDSLTGVGNRYAFNFEINDIPLSELSLFSLDINNLKYYNDNFGHACGDTLICEAVRILGQVFERLYRTGGDEFIAIGTRLSDEQLSVMKSKLSSLMREYNRKEPDVLVEIACGYSSCQEKDISYEDILRRADSEMYKDKVELKKVSRIKSVR